MPAKPATTASSTSAYHSCKRQRIDLIIIDHVPHAAPRLDEVLAELAADVRDVNLDEVGQRVVVLVEDVFVDLRPREHLAAPQRQQLDDGVLAGREGDVLAALLDGALARVEDDVAEDDLAGRQAGGAADQGVDAGQ